MSAFTKSPVRVSRWVVMSQQDEVSVGRFEGGNHLGVLHEILQAGGVLDRHETL